MVFVGVAKVEAAEVLGGVCDRGEGCRVEGLVE